jgi:hypothetical protein
MLATLHSQLHFVRDIQSVNTDGVEPLQSIRDETPEGEKEATIGLEDLRSALAKERRVGRMGRPRRIRYDGEVGVTKTRGRKRNAEDWDVLGSAGETVSVGKARYFVVRSGKGEIVNEAERKRTSAEKSPEDEPVDERPVREDDLLRPPL